MHSRPNARVHWRQAPVTLFILAMAGLVFALMATLGDAVILDWFAFHKVEFNGRRFELVDPGAQY